MAHRRARSSTCAIFRTTGAAPEISTPAMSSIPPLLAKAFCMSTTTSADLSASISMGSGFVFTRIMLSLRLPLIEFSDQLSLHFKTRQRTFWHQVDLRRNTEYCFDLFLDFDFESGCIRPRRRRFSDHLQRRLHARTGLLQQNLYLSRRVRIETRDHVLDRRRKPIHSQHDQHVVGASHAAQSKAGAAAGTRDLRDRYAIPRAKSQQRHAFPLQTGVDQFPRDARLYRQHFRALRVDDLWQNKIRAAEMHPALFRAFTENNWCHIRVAKSFGDARAPLFHHFCAHRWYARTRLRATQNLSEAQLPRIHLTLAPQVVRQVDRIGRRAMQSICAKRFGDEHKFLGGSRPDRNEGRPNQLDGVFGQQPTDEKRQTRRMNHNIGWPDPLRVKRSRRDPCPNLRIAPRRAAKH